MKSIFKTFFRGGTKSRNGNNDSGPTRSSSASYPSGIASGSRREQWKRASSAHTNRSSPNDTHAPREKYTANGQTEEKQQSKRQSATQSKKTSSHGNNFQKNPTSERAKASGRARQDPRAKAKTDDDEISKAARAAWVKGDADREELRLFLSHCCLGHKFLSFLDWGVESIGFLADEGIVSDKVLEDVFALNVLERAVVRSQLRQRAQAEARRQDEEAEAKRSKQESKKKSMPDSHGQQGMFEGERGAKQKQNALATLGLPSSASDLEAKKAFRSLILKWHPDKQKNVSASADLDNGKSAEMFLKVHQAYEVYRAVIAVESKAVSEAQAEAAAASESARKAEDIVRALFAAQRRVEAEARQKEALRKQAKEQTASEAEAKAAAEESAAWEPEARRKRTEGMAGSQAKYLAEAIARRADQEVFRRLEATTMHENPLGLWIGYRDGGDSELNLVTYEPRYEPEAGNASGVW
eukprot:CAMPEP_0172609904 /NCGR_PEP_ID=MMETSP1068-20121228/29800_1 /TAXON_ID=35684 /ORGANISM="Pseudopedinella elastica, Strain CCMP716" /LENGTH=468 /DNA_ID=CAMNT_0013413517 /DNA_START=326 /DNA_END=1729 /DNA_ORIENTATION=-